MIGAAAKKAALAIAPEAALPLEGAFRIARRARAAAAPPVVIQPQEHTPVLRLGKDKYRIRTKGGIRVLEVHRAPSLTAGEAIALGVVGAVGLAAYQFAKSSSASAGNALCTSGPKLSGHCGVLPGADGWGFISW